tara:strand:+ start:387 stop:572 length:186 start_codon:yes stop_codon:yes gene_type:complete
MLQNLVMQRIARNAIARLNVQKIKQAKKQQEKEEKTFIPRPILQAPKFTIAEINFYESIKH